MKKCAKAICVLLLTMAISAGCKKGDTPGGKDFVASIKDKTWVGKITYTGKTPEYYSVHFNVDNTLEWVQLSGGYTGHWLLDGKALTLTFDGNTVEIKAIITDEDELKNIIDNTNSYDVNSSVLLTYPAIPLDNTVWKGTRVSVLNGISLPYEMFFIPGNKVNVTLGSTITTFTYTRQASGAAIRIPGGNFFGVLFSTSEMKGSDTNPSFPWDATKQ